MKKKKKISSFLHKKVKTKYFAKEKSYKLLHFPQKNSNSKNFRWAFFRLFWTAKMLHTIWLNLFSISFRSKLFFHYTISLLALATWRSCYLKYRFNLVKSYRSKLAYVFVFRCPPLVLGYQYSSLLLLFTVFDCT